MVVSQNGWTVVPVSTSGDLVPLVWITGRVRAGDVHTLLAYLCRRFHTEVEPIDRAASWGYAYRPIRGTVSSVSNHSSGTAVDLNAPKHPLGKVGTFTYEQHDAIDDILEDLDGVIRWGGHYAGRKDEMHFEVVGSTAQVAAAVRSILTPNADLPTPKPPAQIEDIMATTQELAALLAPLTAEVDGLRAEVQAASRSTGFRFASEGTVYYANLSTGAYYAVPDPEYHAVLIGLEPDVVEVNTRQRDLIASMCRLAADSITGKA